MLFIHRHIEWSTLGHFGVKVLSVTQSNKYVLTILLEVYHTKIIISSLEHHIPWQIVVAFQKELLQ